MSKILITGGTGFIGSHIVEYFQQMGEDISCITRKDADIRDVNQLKKAFKGADCVIHNAARVNDWGSYKLFYETNVLGTLNVVTACKANNIKQIIITSSTSVYGEEDNKRVKDENSPHLSHYSYFMDMLFPCKMNYYRDTKKLAKELTLAARFKDINITFIEPVWVYGERELKGAFYPYLSLAKDRIPIIMGSKKNNFHVIYARDLARSYYLAYKAELKGLNSFIIGDEKAENMNKIYTLFCNAAGLKKPKNLPKMITYPFAFVFELVCTIINTKKPPLLTRGRVNMFYDNIEYSIQRARDILGFECEYSLEQGIENTVEWYKREGHL